MTNEQIREAFSSLSTPLVADACVRRQVPLRLAPPGVRPVVMGARVAGRVRPVRHYGSVDVFLEALRVAEPGEVLVRNEDAAVTRKVLELLPEKDRSCLLLRFSGMSYSEIARAVGVKESSVGTLLARARARFRSEFIRLKGSDEGVL